MLNNRSNVEVYLVLKYGGIKMNLSAPTSMVFIISVVLVVLAVLSTVAAIPIVTGNAFWISIIGFVILALGNLLKGI